MKYYTGEKVPREAPTANTLDTVHASVLREKGPFQFPPNSLCLLHSVIHQLMPSGTFRKIQTKIAKERIEHLGRVSTGEPPAYDGKWHTAQIAGTDADHCEASGAERRETDCMKCTASLPLEAVFPATN